MDFEQSVERHRITSGATPEHFDRLMVKRIDGVKIRDGKFVPRKPQNATAAGAR